MKKRILIVMVLGGIFSSLFATQVIVDMAGRTVQLPDSDEIHRVFTANPIASIFLYTVEPSLMVGWNTKLNGDAKKVLDKYAVNLPNFGVIYGNGQGASDEAILQSDPQFILMMGEDNEQITSAADEISSRLHLPVLVLFNDLDNMKEAYKIMGEICNLTDRTNLLGDYCSRIVGQARELTASLKNEDKVKVYYSLDDSGLKTYPAGNINAGLIELCGGVNVIDLSYEKKFGTMSIPFEELLLHKPDIILAGSYPSRDRLDGSIFDDSHWALLSAEVEVIPRDPFNFFDKPPSVNRIVGILWLQNILYPDKVDYNVDEEITSFKSLFYGIGG
jgi:iron complex transport system substrate-binding protein